MKLLTIKGCAPCAAIKSALPAGTDIDFVDLSVRTDETAAIKKVMMAEGVRKVPCLYSKGTIIAVGPEAVRTHLGLDNATQQ